MVPTGSYWFLGNLNPPGEPVPRFPGGIRGAGTTQRRIFAGNQSRGTCQPKRKLVAMENGNTNILPHAPSVPVDHAGDIPCPGPGLLPGSRVVVCTPRTAPIDLGGSLG